MNTAKTGYIPQSRSVVRHKMAVNCWPNLLHDDDYEWRVCRHTHAIYPVTGRRRKGLHIPTRWCATAHVKGVNGNAVRVLRWPDRFHRSPPLSEFVFWTISCGDTWKIKFLKWPYQMRTYFVKELRKKFNESCLTPSVWYSKIFDNGHSCAKMFWEPSSNTFCKIKSFSFLQYSVFVECEF